MHWQGSETPMEHFNHVWKYYVEKAKAKNIFIVAHSYGGYLVVDYVSLCFDGHNNIKLFIYSYMYFVGHW